VPRATCSGTRTMVFPRGAGPDKAEAVRGLAGSLLAGFPFFEPRALNGERFAAGNAFDAAG